MKKRVLISILLIMTLCLLNSCKKTIGNELTSDTTKVNAQTSSLTTENYDFELSFETNRENMVAVSDSDILKLKIGMSMGEVQEILKEKYTMFRSTRYPFCHSWKMRDGDFISVYFKIEGCETSEDYTNAFAEAITGVEKTEQLSKLIALHSSAKMVSAVRESNGEYIIDETDD